MIDHARTGHARCLLDAGRTVLDGRVSGEHP